MSFGQSVGQIDRPTDRFSNKPFCSNKWFSARLSHILISTYTVR